MPLYSYVKSNLRGWEGRVHKADPVLGFAPIPGGEGAHVFPIPPNIRMKYDENGFRVPLHYKRESEHYPRPVLITLGGSFTYGDATRAVDTYPYLVGQHLGGYTLNAGVCSYGLAQMLILAKKLVPIHKPDFLVVQYSSWLVGRARWRFTPMYFGKLPSPYFSNSQDRLELHPPLFLTKTMDLPIDKYRNKDKGIIERISFFWNVGLPLYVHDDFHMLVYTLKILLGRVPVPTRNRDKIVKYVYEELSRVANENGARLVIVVLGNSYKPVPVKKYLFPGDSTIVYAHDALLADPSVIDNESYLKKYAHWRGSPPEIVDDHPNEIAHRIIARAIVSKIKDEVYANPQ